MPQRRPILLTGSHRSGSTWVGLVLAAAPGVGYVDEPMNLSHRNQPGRADLAGICAARFETWFPYITEANAKDYESALQRTIEFGFHWPGALRAIRSPKDPFRIARAYARCVANAAAGRRALVKDPLAVFSAPWLENCWRDATSIRPAASASEPGLAWPSAWRSRSASSLP